ncbi:hypothetical protein HOLleu_25873 [Holothuria leucospilota]|uniref:DUF5641 domain-containing protein n=1 Tax=Holothuria leucospilota TaxID=206669 RepID=A0A9Q1BT94_HOLLE|nr:hypothetical protein HOLleu_25873 [Holothuria leucospilota]
MLLVRESHRHALHGGHLRTAAEVRKRYWVIGDVNVSRRVVHDCIICKRQRGKPVNQKMAEVVKLYPGKDDLVRVVDVRFADDIVVKRPVTKLILLMKGSERSDVS